ncbi:MAG: hypothetical protein LBG89_04050 [Rickettsiales bacterium]|jgi:hypothetical protein|nr:hypothetical protein [Rickettsiales bacterium]
MINTTTIGIGSIAVLLGAFAVAVSLLKPGKSAQAVRAVGVVAIFAGWFWLSFAAAIWAVLDFVLPNKEKLLKQYEELQKKTKKQ